MTTKGYITLALWSGRLDSKSADGHPSEATQSVEKELIPEYLQKHNTDLWLCIELIEEESIS